VGDLSEVLHISHVDAVKAVLRLGIMATVNEEIDFQTAAQVAHSFEPLTALKLSPIRTKTP